jgi:hypothetical protein
MLNTGKSSGAIAPTQRRVTLRALPCDPVVVTASVRVINNANYRTFATDAAGRIVDAPAIGLLSTSVLLRRSNYES